MQPFLEHRTVVGVVGFLAMLFFSSIAFSMLENALTLIFFHLVLHHSHYYLMFAPGVAMLQAVVRVVRASGIGRLGIEGDSMTVGLRDPAVVRWHPDGRRILFLERKRESRAAGVSAGPPVVRWEDPPLGARHLHSIEIATKRERAWTHGTDFTVLTYQLARKMFSWQISVLATAAVWLAGLDVAASVGDLALGREGHRPVPRSSDRALDIEGRRAEFIVCLPTCVATPGEHDTMLRRLRATPTVYESCRSRALPGGIDDNDSVGA